MLDGSAILWCLDWPKDGFVSHLAEKMLEYVERRLIYIVFDRYKGSTRSERAKNLAYQHQFALSTPLPSKEKALSFSSNMVQIIDILFDFLSLKVADRKFHNSLVITGSKDIPIQVNAGLTIPRHDLRMTHEEADLIIVQQCYGLVYKEGCDADTIISDDTDVFALACHYFPLDRSDVIVKMEPTKACRTVTDIGETARKHESIIPSLRAAHALTEC